jgi:hypothetical protein
MELKLKVFEVKERLLSTAVPLRHVGAKEERKYQLIVTPYPSARCG